MNNFEVSSAMKSGYLSAEVEVNVLRKTLETRQNIAMEIINKNAEISKKIQEESLDKTNLIDHLV